MRVLCVDAVRTRLTALVSLLQSEGFDAWAAQNVRDAVALVAGLQFDALLVDLASAQRDRDDWELLASTQPQLPVLVHSAATSISGDACESKAIRTENPEVTLAILTLLLNPGITMHN
jgi:CheY-like chemotaxis protein